MKPGENIKKESRMAEEIKIGDIFCYHEQGHKFCVNEMYMNKYIKRTGEVKVFESPSIRILDKGFFKHGA